MGSFLFSLYMGHKTEVWGDTRGTQLLIGLLALNDALLGNGLDQMVLQDPLCDSAAIRDQRGT